LAVDGYKVALHGRFEVLVNNAGQSSRIPHVDLKAAMPEMWRRIAGMITLPGKSSLPTVG
jgi:hypothetical protein